MINLFSIVADGFHTAITHWQLLLVILVLLLLSQFLVYSLLKRIFGNEFSDAEYYSLSLGGWLFGASLISLFWFLLGLFLSPQVSAFITIILAFAISLILSLRLPATESSSSKLVPLTLIPLTLLFIILRLSFISRALFPMYFDSAQHYMLSKNILLSVEQSDFSIGSLTNYYHLGFHFLTAFLAFISRAQINDILLILGQIILAALPLSFFFIVRYWTRSNSVGIFAVLLAAFGWYMPAHAMDWGKYPALASLALIPFVLSLSSLVIRNRTMLSRSKYWALIIIAIAGFAVAVFLHSRALVVFILIAFAWILTSLWQKIPRLLQFILLIILTIVLITSIVLIQRKGILGPLFDPYGPSGWVITSAVLFLSIFAYWLNPSLVFLSILSVLLLLGSLFVPLGTLIPGYTNTTLLDRPFVEMILYLPLSVLGGFGLAGLERKLQNITSRNIPFVVPKIMSSVFILLVVGNALFKYDPYASNCCVIMSQDDISAIEWMDSNLPKDARILISSTDLNVLPTREYQGSAGGDAGTWIDPLIARTTVYMPYNTDFSQQQAFDTICQSQVRYIYVGKTGSAFDESRMDSQPDKYQLLFSLPKAKVYQVTGCP